MSFIIACLAGLATGVLTGAGIGGGTLLVLYLTALGGVSQAAAQGINLLYFLASAPPALAGHIKNRLIEVKGGLIAALCGSVCAFASAMLTRSLDDTVFRRVFGVLFLIVGVKELFAKRKTRG